MLLKNDAIRRTLLRLRPTFASGLYLAADYSSGKTPFDIRAIAVTSDNNNVLETLGRAAELSIAAAGAYVCIFERAVTLSLHYLRNSD